MTAECCCTVKSIALDYQSLEHQQQITDESDLRCLAVNVCIYVCVCVCVCMCWRESEMNKDKDNDRVCVCAQERV